MHDMLSAVAGLLLIALFGVLVATFYYLDQLIRREYSFHRQAWERDGRPNGFVFRPPEVRFFSSCIAFQWCSVAWSFYTPEWVRADPIARTLHRRMRVCGFISNAGFVGFIFFIVPRL